MYDEYYYYVEFDGNSFLAVGFSGLFVFVNYVRVSAWHATIGAFLLLLIVPALVCWFLWRSWYDSLRGFFDDLEAAGSQHPGSASTGPSCEGDRVR